MRPFLALLIFDQRYRTFTFRAAFVLYFAAVIIGCVPGARAEMGSLAPGLVLHALGYSFIALLLFTGANGSAWSKALKSFLIVALMGAFDEYVQSFFPYRRAAVTDWLVDIGAAFITSCMLWTVWPKQSRGQRADGYSH
jgi:VanZ family protein